MTRAAFIAAVVLGLAAAAADVALTPDPCGVPTGETCSTDTECECMHGADE